MLLAIEPGTKLWVYPEGCAAAAEAAVAETAEAAEAASKAAAAAAAPFVVRLEVGEVMVWRGDLVSPTLHGTPRGPTPPWDLMGPSPTCDGVARRQLNSTQLCAASS